MGTFRGVIPTDFPSLGSPWLISGLASLYGRSRIADWLRISQRDDLERARRRACRSTWCGAKMTDYYPLSIVVHGVALNITVQSHVDQLCFGLIACRRAVPDVHELGNQLQRAMATPARWSRRQPLPPSAAPAKPRPRTPPAAGRPPARASARARAKADAPRAQRPADGGCASSRRRACVGRRIASERQVGRGSASRAGARSPPRVEGARREDSLAECLRRPRRAAPRLLPSSSRCSSGTSRSACATFRHSAAECARASKTLAANQGLYNGFLAAGLPWGLALGAGGNERQGVLPRPA